MADVHREMSNIQEIFTNDDNSSNAELSLTYVCKSLETIGDEYAKWCPEQKVNPTPDSQRDDSKLVQQMEGLVTTILLCIQDTVKYGRENHQQQDEPENDDEAVEEENKEKPDGEGEVDGVKDLSDNHLTIKMLENVEKQLKFLKLKKVSYHRHSTTLCL